VLVRAALRQGRFASPGEEGRGGCRIRALA
jgi:hypothetical protein